MDFADYDTIPERFSTRRFLPAKRIPSDRYLSEFDLEKANLSDLVNSKDQPPGRLKWHSQTSSPIRDRKRYIKDRTRQALSETQPRLRPELEFTGKRDVLLIVGNGENKVRLRVSSNELGSAYRIMLRQNHTKLKNKNARELYLPDEDPAAIEVICGILHGATRFDGINDLELIHRVAVASDKYQVCQALSGKFTVWLDRWCDNRRPGQLEADFMLLSAAYLARHPNAFCNAMIWILEEVLNDRIFEYMDYRVHQLPLPEDIICE